MLRTFAIEDVLTVMEQEIVIKTKTFKILNKNKLKFKLVFDFLKIDQKIGS